MAKVFISYSRKDTEFAKKLTEELKKSDLDFWIDWEGIPPTVDWWREIEKGIEESDVFLFLISPDSAESKVCGQEIDAAVKNAKRIIPLVVRDIKADEAPTQLGHLNWIFFREGDDFDASLEKLMTAIQTDYEWVAIHRRLQVKALEWERAFKESSLLLRGKDLKDADIQIKTNATKNPSPSDLQNEYILKSHKNATRQKWVIALTSLAIIVICALAVFALYSRNGATSNAQIAIENQHAAETAQANAQANAQIAATQKAISDKQISHQLTYIARQLFSYEESDPTVPVLLATYSMQTSPNEGAKAILQDYLLQNSRTSTGTDEEIITSACATLPRNLTQSEWDQFFSDVIPYRAVCDNLPIE